MTLIELQEKLGKQIDDLTDPRVPFESKKKLADIATVVSSLAKQMLREEFGDIATVKVTKTFADLYRTEDKHEAD